MKTALWARTLVASLAAVATVCATEQFAIAAHLALYLADAAELARLHMARG